MKRDYRWADVCGLGLRDQVSLGLRMTIRLMLLLENSIWDHSVVLKAGHPEFRDANFVRSSMFSLFRARVAAKESDARTRGFCRLPRGLNRLQNLLYPGFRFARPGAICRRLLRRLCDVHLRATQEHSTTEVSRSARCYETCNHYKPAITTSSRPRAQRCGVR